MTCPRCHLPVATDAHWSHEGGCECEACLSVCWDGTRCERDPAPVVTILRYDTGGVPQFKCDTNNPARVEEHYQRLLQHCPEYAPRLVRCRVVEEGC